MPRQSAIALGLAALWGVFATWVFWWLFVLVMGALFWASESGLKALSHGGWTREQIEPYFEGLTTVLPAVFYGLIFGFPLGLFAKGRLFVAWAVFVVAFLIALCARMLVDGQSPGTVAHNLFWSLYFVMFLAALLFAFLGYRVRAAYVNHHAAA